MRNIDRRVTLLERVFGRVTGGGQGCPSRDEYLRAFAREEARRSLALEEIFEELCPGFAHDPESKRERRRNRALLKADTHEHQRRDWETELCWLEAHRDAVDHDERWRTEDLRRLLAGRPTQGAELLGKF